MIVTCTTFEQVGFGQTERAVIVLLFWLQSWLNVVLFLQRTIQWTLRPHLLIVHEKKSSRLMFYCLCLLFTY